ncbi:MAG: hypothetical protein IT429_05245 [Gemmataceae bacterium]|nr:hypothetical protein [Gemmataceae bacterium]
MAETQGSGLVRRGLVLLGVLVAILVGFWAILLRNPGQELPAEKRSPERVAALVVAPAAAFPGAVAWPSVVGVADLLPSASGWQVRYNAAVALARRGSSNLPFDVLAEMLDEDQQMRNFRARLQDGREVPDETAARRTVLQALRAVAEWHRHPEALKAVGQDNIGLKQVHAAIAELTRSPNLVVKTEAANVQLSLRKG